MGLSMMMTVVPIVLLIIGLVFFIRKYKLTEERMQAVSYTHLDVYKRQI